MQTPETSRMTALSLLSSWSCQVLSLATRMQPNRPQRLEDPCRHAHSEVVLSFESNYERGFSVAGEKLHAKAITCTYTWMQFVSGGGKSAFKVRCKPQHLRASRPSNTDVLTRIGWPTLAWRRRRYKHFLFWQMTKGQGPPPPAVQVCVSTQASQTLRKRTIETPIVPFGDVFHSCRIVSYACIILCNSLPLFITSCSSSSSCLSSLDSHFKSDMS